MTTSIYYQNVRGLRTKTRDCYLNILRNNYDIICFTETWLLESINSNEIVDERYIVFRNDRYSESTTSKLGGGVLIAIKDKYIVHQLNEMSDEIEDLWIKIRMEKDHSFMVIPNNSVIKPLFLSARTGSLKKALNPRRRQSPRPLWRKPPTTIRIALSAKGSPPTSKSPTLTTKHHMPCFRHLSTSHFRNPNFMCLVSLAQDWNNSYFSEAYCPGTGSQALLSDSSKTRASPYGIGFGGVD